MSTAREGSLAAQRGSMGGTLSRAPALNFRDAAARFVSGAPASQTTNAEGNASFVPIPVPATTATPTAAEATGVDEMCEERRSQQARPCDEQNRSHAGQKGRRSEEAAADPWTGRRRSLSSRRRFQTLDRVSPGSIGGRHYQSSFASNIQSVAVGDDPLDALPLVARSTWRSCRGRTVARRLI